MSRTDGLPAFGVAQVEQVVVLTVLLQNFSLHNASWFKDQLLSFVERYRPPQVVINLVNVQHLDRLGVGILISLNAQLKHSHKLCFAGLQPELEALLKAMYLRHAFRVVDPARPCLVCGHHACQHTASWEQSLQQFLFVEQQPPEIPDLQTLQQYELSAPAPLPLEQLVAAFEQDPNYQWLESQRERREFWQKVRQYLAVGLLATAFVAGALVVILISMNQRWFDALDRSKKTMRQPVIEQKQRIMTYEEIVDRFDKDGDGLFTKEDWMYLNSSEKLMLINHGFHERQLKNRNPFQVFGQHQTE